jgi:hypothetical protein
MKLISKTQTLIARPISATQCYSYIVNSTIPTHTTLNASSTLTTRDSSGTTVPTRDECPGKATQHHGSCQCDVEAPNFMLLVDPKDLEVSDASLTYNQDVCSALVGWSRRGNKGGWMVPG